MAEDAYFKTPGDVETYERAQPANARYNLDLLALEGIRPEMMAGRRVLDVGCGFGLFLSRFRAAGARCFGMDKSGRAIRTCRERYPGMRFEKAECPEIPFDEKFALITCFGTLGLVARESHAEFLENAASHLEKGGVLFANAPGEGAGLGPASAGNARSLVEWEGLLARAGFRTTAAYRVLRVPGADLVLGRNIFVKGFGRSAVIVGER